MKHMKRGLAWLLALCMLFSMLSVSAFADDELAAAEPAAVQEETAEAPEAEEPAAEETPTEEAVELLEEGSAAALTTAATKPTAPDDGTVSGCPFVKGTAGSNSFRIPAMVTLSDGTLVAAADARWNCTYDGGGLDTLVARSTNNGATWSWAFANYLGDHGNEYNGPESTAFVDPALAVAEDDTIYMLVDLFPYGVALNGNDNTWPNYETGFNEDGQLLLSDDNGSSYKYYLDGNVIKDSTGAAVSGYAVDAYFNVSQNGSYVSNLFFSDSPYKVARTGYLYLTKSDDGGESWSDPTLINVKTTAERACLVGPGRGTVLTDGTILFPVYSYDYNNGWTKATQVCGFIYSTDGGATWARSDSGISDSSESAIVELSESTIRVFYRNLNSRICYVDVTREEGTYSWGASVTTEVACNSNTELSAIKVTEGGVDYILVSNPGNESNQSGASYRTNGQIVTFKAADMSVVNTTSVPSVHTTNSFMYSCMSQLDSGDIAILYEDQENGWGVGANCYYQMNFMTFTLAELGIETTEEPENTPVVDTDTGTSVLAPAGTDITAISVEETAVPAITKAYVAYDITLNNGDYTGEADVTIPLSDALKSASSLTGFVVEKDGTINQIPGKKNDDGTYTFRSPHFSTVGAADNSGDETVTLTVGQTSGTYTVSDTNLGSATGTTENGVASYVQTGTAASTGYAEATVTCYTLKSSNNGGGWKSTGYYYQVADGNFYKLYAKRSSSWSLSGTTYTYTWGYSTTDSTNNVTEIGAQETTNTAAAPNITVYSKTGTPTSASTTIQFTGLAAGTTTVTVGGKTYSITVVETTEATKTIAVGVDSDPIAVTLEDGETVEWASSDANTVAVVGDDTNQATLVGSKAGNADVIGTIKNADGTVKKTYTWHVTVTDTNTNSKYIYLTVSKIENTTVYYSVNGGELIKVNGTGLLLDEAVTGHYQLLFFAAPDDRHALTYMSSTNSAGQYYCLSDDGEDGTESSAWPFADGYDWATKGASTSGNDATVYDTTVGIRWGLAEGNISVNQLKNVYARALALGCDGVLVFTKNNAGTTYDYSSNGNNLHSDLTFVSQPLPTVEKELVSVGGEAYTPGMKADLGDELVYKVTVTRPATQAAYGTITYSNENLQDALTGNAGVDDPIDGTKNGISDPDMDISTTSAKTWTYSTGVILSTKNFNQLVKNGTITNTVDFSYSYKSQYSNGTLNQSANAVAEEVSVDLPEYVVDFGLPITFEVPQPVLGTGVNITKGDASYGTVSIVNGNIVTYTPDKTTTMKGIDHVKLTLSDGYSYGVNIYPATTVYYEADFAAYSGFTVTGTNPASQTASAVGDRNRYGYDDVYVGANTAGTVASSSDKGSTAEFTFTGTGVEIYTKNTESTGRLFISVEKDGTVEKSVIVDTAMRNGTTDATKDQNVTANNVPVATILGLSHGEHKVTIRHLASPVTDDNGKNTYVTYPVTIDGFRVFGTLKDQGIKEYKLDSEENPTFVEMRSAVLKAVGIDAGTDLNAQVAAAISGQDASAVVVTSATDITAATAQDLLNNGPKNEIYLQKDESLVFKLTTEKTVQLGMRVLDASTNYTINGGTTQGMKSTTDMFYNLQSASNGAEKTYTISNTGSGILAITLMKVSDDPEFAMGTLTEDDFMQALIDLGLVSKPDSDSEPEIENPFEDVPNSAWFYKNVMWGYQNGVIAGTDKTHFSPNASCTRAQAISFIWRAAGRPQAAEGTVNPFKDVSANAYYYQAVLWAVEQGIVKGVSSDQFAPNETCTRAQIMAFINRWAGRATAGESTANPFRDVADSQYYYKAVLWGVEQGIVKGVTAREFAPDAVCTRAQIIAFIARYAGK